MRSNFLSWRLVKPRVSKLWRLLGAWYHSDNGRDIGSTGGLCSWFVVTTLEHWCCLVSSIANQLRTASLREKLPWTLEIQVLVRGQLNTFRVSQMSRVILWVGYINLGASTRSLKSWGRYPGLILQSEMRLGGNLSHHRSVPHRIRSENFGIWAWWRRGLWWRLTFWCRVWLNPNRICFSWTWKRWCFLCCSCEFSMMHVSMFFSCCSLRCIAWLESWFHCLTWGWPCWLDVHLCLHDVLPQQFWSDNEEKSRCQWGCFDVVWVFFLHLLGILTHGRTDLRVLLMKEAMMQSTQEEVQPQPRKCLLGHVLEQISHGCEEVVTPAQQELWLRHWILPPGMRLYRHTMKLCMPHLLKHRKLHCFARGLDFTRPGLVLPLRYTQSQF